MSVGLDLGVADLGIASLILTFCRNWCAITFLGSKNSANA
jgi:hypothetical protein